MIMIHRQQPYTTTKMPQIKGQYIALISQAGTANPTVIVIKNTLPTTGMPIWSRTNTGQYIFQSATTGYFPVGLVMTNISHNKFITENMAMAHSSTEHITVLTGISGAVSDSVLAFTPIVITIWDRLED